MHQSVCLSGLVIRTRWVVNEIYRTIRISFSFYSEREMKQKQWINVPYFSIGSWINHACDCFCLVHWPATIINYLMINVEFLIDCGRSVIVLIGILIVCGRVNQWRMSNETALWVSMDQSRNLVELSKYCCLSHSLLKRSLLPTCIMNGPTFTAQRGVYFIDYLLFGR